MRKGATGNAQKQRRRRGYHLFALCPAMVSGCQPISSSENRAFIECFGPISSSDYRAFVIATINKPDLTPTESPKMFYANLKTTASQQLLLRASDEAVAFIAAKGPRGTAAAARAKKPEEVENEAQAHVVSKGGDPGNHMLVLGCLGIQFGKYQGQTFRRLLENDVGYTTRLDARARATQPGCEGEALVGFGDYKEATLKDLYDSKDKKHQTFVKWLRRKTPQPGTSMDAARKYILGRDKERSAEAAAAGGRWGRSSPTTTSSGPQQGRCFCRASRSLPCSQPYWEGVQWPQSRLPESWRTALTGEEQEWIGRELFKTDSEGRTKLTTDLKLWWDPPQPRPSYTQPPASPAAFFACRLFLWTPLRLWSVRPTCCNRALTKCGLYRTIRRVLDIDGWYLMATEYLECCRCKRKVAAWSQEVVGQLGEGHRALFPAILTYKLACDRRVIIQLRERTRGNSATQLYKKLCEAHTEAWMRWSIHYLSVMEPFTSRGVVRRCTPPPKPPPVPQYAWLLLVYCHDILSHLEDVKARVTSVFGTVLKMDSTKKVTRKLAGAAAQTAAWATNVGNEHGQVLMSVLTDTEGAGLLSMAAGLMRWYRDAGVEPPQLLYVDRDCCSSHRGSKTADMFGKWDKLVVRLDIWHLMWRFASDGWRTDDEFCDAVADEIIAHPRISKKEYKNRDSILLRYQHIQDLVLGHQRLMARAPIQLYELNCRTLSLWFTRTQREKERTVLTRTAGSAAAAPATAAVDRPPAAATAVPTGQAASRAVVTLEAAPAVAAPVPVLPAFTACPLSCCPGRTTGCCSCNRTFSSYTASPSGPLTAPAECEGAPHPNAPSDNASPTRPPSAAAHHAGPQLPALQLLPGQQGQQAVQAAPPAQPQFMYKTQWLRRKKAEQRAAAGTVDAQAGVPQVQKCRKCGQPKQRETPATAMYIFALPRRVRVWRTG
ncbi:unnamed protein product [Leuciscus chuanchicus]